MLRRMRILVFCFTDIVADAHVLYDAATVA
jgi:hypothetical protein